MISPKTLRYVAILLLSPILLPLTGCGPSKKPTGVVRGKVIFGDKKVAGTVRFVGADGATGEGIIYNDGTYEVSEAPLGQCRIAIVTEHLEKKQSSTPGGGGPGVMPGMRDRPATAPPGGGSSKPPPDAQGKMNKPPVGDAPESDRVPNIKVIPIPSKYKSADTSELSFEVQKGVNEYDIVLK